MNKTLALGVAAAALTAGAAMAQPVSLTLSGGFTPDPRELPVRAGGTVDRTGITGCNGGFTAEQPTVRIAYSGDGALIFSMQSAADTTLVIRGPDGNFVCNDDAEGGGLNPEVPIYRARTGTYEVWAGRFGFGDPQPPADAVLRISAQQGVDRQPDGPGEEMMMEEPPVTAPPNPDARPTASLRLSAGFRPDPNSRPVQAGGPLTARAIEGCNAGQVSDAATLRLDYRTGRQAAPLVISAASDGDATLAVRGPDGVWSCNDDGPVSLDPQVVFETPRAGRYDIYVGRFGSSTETFPATLRLSATVPPPPPEMAMPEGMEGGFEEVAPTAPPNPGQSPTQGSVTLRGGSAVSETQVQAGGPLTAYAIEGCNAGFVTSAPSVVLTYTAGSGPLVMSAASTADTTLAVHGPDGQWTCNDDNEGLDPLISVARPASGRYAIYVGRFGEQTTLAPATLRIAGTPPPTSVTPEPAGATAPPVVGAAPPPG